MKHFKPILKATLLLMFATIAMKAAAYDFYEGGIYYTITDWDAVEVSAPDYYSSYSGDIVIPSTVTVQVSQYYESYPMTYTVTGIGYNAFNGSYISSITLPNTIEYIDNAAFYECYYLQEIDIPNSVISICESAFGYCTGLTSIEIPNSVDYIGWNAFYCCTGLTDVKISSSVSELGGTFFGCTGLKHVEIPSSVQHLDGTFKNCTSLTSIIIPSSVTTLGYNTFYGCDNLSVITCEAVTPPYTTDNNSFSQSVYDLAKLFVPVEAMSTYANTAVWERFVNIFGIGTEVTTGDVDGDGQISIADLTNLVDLIMSGAEPSTSSDIDGDGSLTIADITALVDILLQ